MGRLERKEPRVTSLARAQVTAKIAQGKLNKTIAHELAIHEGTVKAHISQLSADWCCIGDNRVVLAMIWLAQQTEEAQRKFLAGFYDARRNGSKVEAGGSDGRTTWSGDGLVA